MSSGTGKGTRTRSGCKTCRNRRKKCDEGRPICQVCSRLGIQCGGYELALVWGNGVASRGRLKGAIVPLPKTRVNEEPSKAIPLGRDRAPSKTSLDYSTPMITDDLNVEVVGSSPGSSSNTGSANYEDEFYSVGLLSDVEPLSPALIESLIRDFFISGHHTLYSSSKADSPVVKAILPLAENSPTVRSVCATYQALVLQISVTQFQSLYDTALRQFRSDLTDPALRNQDSTVASGILLCSLGISQSLPWTFHVKPLLEILTTRQDFSESPFHAHALDIMGWYDLPGFVLNRRCARLDIWRRFSSKHESDGEYIEPVSNLPRSLLGILSSLEDPDCEERLWMWQGMEGTTLEIVLWDAYRYAAMLKHRELQRDYRRNLQTCGLQQDDLMTDAKTDLALPTDMVLLNRLVSCLEILVKLHEDNENNPQLLNAINYPLFIAGSQMDLLARKREWENLIKEIFLKLGRMGMKQVGPMLEILRIMREGSPLTADQIADSMGLEVSLH